MKAVAPGWELLPPRGKQKGIARQPGVELRYSRAMNYQERMRRTRLGLDDSRLDALVVTHLANIRYLCGFTGSAGVLVVGRRETVFFTDGRYRQQAREEVCRARVRIVKGKSALAAASEWLAKNSYRRVGIEAAHLTVAERSILERSLPPRARLIRSRPIIEELRMVKDSDEIAKIRAACRLGSELFLHLLKVIRPGVTESEVAGELEFRARQSGAEQMSFPTIVAGGARSALPHGRASSSPIPPRGFVVSDFGVILAGYCSDMTRTVHLGRPRAEARSAYGAVEEAQQAALAAARPGRTVAEVDRAARKSLQRRGLAKFFTHSTGHGVGLEIHESPRIAAGEKEPLKAGMVITIEPGVYVPGNWGVRIEDTVLITTSGCEVLTPSPKDLIML